MNFQIGARHIGPGEPCFIIAEVGLAHDGSLSQAHAYVDAIAKSGADAAKFQCHLGDPVSEWRVQPEWPQDATRQAYWQRTGFSKAEWQSLAEHCRDSGLVFLCSPFSVEAVRLLDPLVSAWKVPSGKVTDSTLLQAIGATGKPVLLSTGMGTRAEIQAEIWALKGGFPIELLQCTSVYPCPPELIDLTTVKLFHGLSDHSGTIYPGIAAAALGCQVLEVHVCWSKEQGGFDTAASITVDELAQLVQGVRFVEKAMQPVDKDKMAAELQSTRNVFMVGE